MLTEDAKAVLEAAEAALRALPRLDRRGDRTRAAARAGRRTGPQAQAGVRSGARGGDREQRVAAAVRVARPAGPRAHAGQDPSRARPARRRLTSGTGPSYGRAGRRSSREGSWREARFNSSILPEMAKSPTVRNASGTGRFRRPPSADAAPRRADRRLHHHAVSSGRPRPESVRETRSTDRPIGKNYSE